MATAISTLGPVEFDTILAELWRQYHELDNYQDSVITQIHHDANDRKEYFGRSRTGWWKMSTDRAVGFAQQLLDNGQVAAYNVAGVTQRLARYAAGVANLAAKRAEIRVMDVEYESRPWPRFFEVTSSNGHIHSSMHCSTCNNGRAMTQFEWHPELSGLTEADAVEKLGPILCSVCYASAPVAWKRDRADIAREAKAAAPEVVKAGPFAQIKFTDAHGWKQSETFKTPQMAQNWVVAQRSGQEAYGYAFPAEPVAEITALLIAAGFVTREALDAKVAAKAKRDKREGEKHARALGLI
jgi:hypothetical protein